MVTRLTVVMAARCAVPGALQIYQAYPAAPGTAATVALTPRLAPVVTTELDALLLLEPPPNGPLIEPSLLVRETVPGIPRATLASAYPPPFIAPPYPKLASPRRLPCL